MCELHNEVERLKEENDLLRKYAAMLLGEYGHNIYEGLDIVSERLADKEDILSTWEKYVEMEKW